MFLLFASLVGKSRQRLSKRRRSALAAVKPSACPSRFQRSMSCIERKRILLAEFDDNFRVAPGSSSITANYLEVGLLVINVDEGRYMTGFDRVRDGFFDERPRRSDLAEVPLCDCEVGPRGRAGILAKAERGLTIPFGIVNAQRLNEICLRVDEITLEEARVSRLAEPRVAPSHPVATRGARS